MGELKRRDLINYFNDRHLSVQKNQYDFNILSNDLKQKFIDFLTNSNEISYNNIHKKIIHTSSEMFDVQEDNITYRASFYDSIDLVFKVYLELYENVMVTDNANEFYQKFILANKGKFSKFFMDFNDLEIVDTLINSIRNKNVKIMVISTYGLKNKFEIGFLNKIATETNCLILLDDFNNYISNDDIQAIISLHSNIIVLKSVFERNKREIITSFIISRETNISTLKCFENYLDIDVFALINIYINLKDNTFIEESHDLKDIEEIKEDVIEEKKSISETKEIQNNTQKTFEEIKKDYTKNEETKVDEVVLDNTDILLSKESEFFDHVFEKTNIENSAEIEMKVREYNPVIPKDDKFALIAEVTKFSFISIFSSNENHVYILSKTPIYANLTEKGIVLKKYNSSNGEIIRLIIGSSSQNVKVLKLIYEISLKRNI